MSLFVRMHIFPVIHFPPSRLHWHISVDVLLQIPVVLGSPFVFVLHDDSYCTVPVKVFTKPSSSESCKCKQKLLSNSLSALTIYTHKTLSSLQL
jgi:hypothetical protein